MSGRLRICDDHVFKRFPVPAHAEAAIWRTGLARSAGVRTPPATLLKHGRTVLFQRIGGVVGRAAIDGAGPGRLAQLLKPLVRLHAMDAVAGLRDFDPLEKLVPRLVPGVRAALLPVVESALSEIGRAATRRRVIHGDFHAGQILLDGGGDAWLLDFDDMAVGDPAADIGNFCAHLATSDATSQAAPLAAMRHWLSVTFSAYGLAGGDANPALADAYGRIALVRRALKAHEKGNVDLLHGMRRDQ